MSENENKTMNNDEMTENEAQTAEKADKSPEELCRELCCPTCNVKAEAEDIRLRALAEMDNFKKRLQRDYDERMQYAAEKVLADLIPSLDSLDLAIRYADQSPASKDMLTGITMTRKLLLDALKPHGFERIGSEGEAFDPEIHEAVAYEERNDMDAGLVSTLHQSGYKLKNRLLRPAKVSVSKKEE
ncbi:MAG: nucleotide exchange factor GrpE [Desulfovibrionaceae bacterium]|nr:nucleotide exchange factor GrpE [Desulfovibrionaceae bacterium]